MKKIIIQYCWILGIVALVFLLASCSTPQKQTKKDPNVYDGSLGLVIGCMFSPADCKKMKNDIEQQKITKEWEEIDKQNSNK